MKNKLIILIFIIIFLVGTLSYSLGLFSGGGAQASSLEKGLVAWYPLNGEYGTKDATPNANHGTNNGATLSTGRKGESNGAYSFDGVDDQVSLPIFSDMGQNTISMWVYRDDSSTRMLYSNDQSSNWKNSISTQYWYTRISSSSTRDNLALPSIPLNSWTHLVFTYDRNDDSKKIYKDGILSVEKSPTSHGSGDLYLSSSTVHLIGNSNDGSNWNGKLSDFRIYDRALSVDEIKLLYDSFKPEIATSDLNKGLVGHWMLDSENGAKDLTPNGNHGTANGGITLGETTDRKGKTGGATSFDGVDDYIDTGIEENITEYTLSGWFFRDNTIGRYATIIGSKTDPRPAAGFELESLPSGGGSTLLWLYPSSVLKTPYSLNEWHFFTITRNASKTRLYMDNILIGEENSVNTGIIPSMLIGNWRIGSSQYFRGKMSDIRLYNRVLSDPEIKLLYDSYKPKEASIGSLQKGLVLDMPLTTKHMKSSTVVSDRTPYGNDGTVVGATVGSQYTSFDGSDDYVDLPSDLGYDSEISAFAWFKKIGSPSGGYHIIFGGGELEISIPTSGAIRTGIYTDARYVSNHGSGLLDGNWHLVGFTFNGSNKSSYIDGEFVGQQTGITGDLISSFSNRRIGRFGSSTAYYTNGSISNVKIYNRALNEDEIKLLYEKGRS